MCLFFLFLALCIGMDPITAIFIAIVAEILIGSVPDSSE